MSRKLKTTTVFKGVVYEAGTPESKIDGASKITADVWDGKAAKADPERTEPTGFAAMDKDQLEAEVEKRNTDRDDDAKIQVTGTGANGNVLKGDLVTALEADDKAQAAQA